MASKVIKDKHLPLNALDSVVVTGLVKTNEGTQVDLSADIRTPPPMIIENETTPVWIRPEGVPPRIVLRHPVPKHLRLELKIGEKIGGGRCGSVYAATAVRLFDPANPADSLDYPKAPILPELVIKVAEPHQMWRLEQEAGAYEELQVLQGVSVARCYGWFEAKLADGWSLLGSENDDNGYTSDSSEESEESDEANYADLSDVSSDTIDSDDTDYPGRAEPSDVVTFLVLERLGGFLTMRQDYYEETDIYEVYEDLAHLGITHDDVCYSNLLLAAPSPPGFRRRRCPFHHHAHRYRIIDFDKAYKGNITSKVVRDKHLPSNALASAMVSGLVKTSEGTQVDISAEICAAPPMLIDNEMTDVWIRPDGVPPRTIVPLPDAKHLCLELNIGQKLGAGRCGSVYAATAVRLFDPANPADSLDYPKAPILPELVIKVAEPHQRWRLEQEAGAYEEMQIIQGVSVARCYGLFKAKLEDGWSLLGSENNHDGYSSDESDDSDDPDSRRGREEPSDVVSFLVLERLGGFLTMRKSYYKKTDIYEAYEDLARLGITHDDVRYSNLLRAAPSPPGFKRRRCPFHQHSHRYRIIDFDKAYKGDVTVEHNIEMSRYALRRVFEGIKGGFEMEPW
ncbi:hypothetical protein A0H81_06134 [Grifola frondosa]|uniref:Protein kinase domain-containing protein n=1 Tax=Grifola frondosa TaxID=5627 RepID=A0A1C7MA83_GRIFR|nr:hypothetical protein A0H81_06134 [Grifola frondosa]